MTHILVNKAKCFFVLLIFCAANTGFSINSQVPDPARPHDHDSSGIFTSHQPDTKEQKILSAQAIKETKSLIRSERIAQKLVHKSTNSHRPGNGKKFGWFILWALLGVGMILSAALFVVVYDIVVGEGETGAGWLLGGAIVFASLFVLIFVKLLGWEKKYPGNNSVK